MNPGTKILLSCLIFFHVVNYTVAFFSLHPTATKETKVALQLNSSLDKPTRRQAILLPIELFIIIGSTASSVTSFPRPVHADVENTRAYRSALRTVKSASKELGNMATLASTNDYAGIKQALRVPPFTEVRKTCTILIKEVADSDEALKLQKNYADFIKSIEELDTSATLGMRGRKNIQLQPSFDRANDALGAFLEAAQQNAVIPVAFAE
jgi:hypothetical protein